MPDTLACAVVNCNNKRRTCPGLKFFRFPKDSKRREEWISRIGQGQGNNETTVSVCKSAVLCDQHFEDSQFVNNSRKRLKSGAVPTIFNFSHGSKNFNGVTDAEDTELQNGVVESRNLSDASEMNLEIISIQQQFPDLDAKQKHYIFLSVDSTLHDVQVLSSPVGRAFLESINLVEIFTNYCLKYCHKIKIADQPSPSGSPSSDRLDLHDVDDDFQDTQQPAYDCPKNSVDGNSEEVKHLNCDDFIWNLKNNNCSSPIAECLEDTDKKKHVNKRSSEVSFTCNICGNQSTDFNHMLLHGSDLPFDCLLCLKRMTSVDVLEKHVSVHVSRRTGDLVGCDEGILLQSKVENIKIEPNDCEGSKAGDANLICDEPVKRKRRRKRKKLKETESLCNFCGCIVPIHIMKRHLLIHETENKCEKCPKELQSDEKLEHLKVDQPDETVFECIICNKRLCSAYRLKLHELHHGEKSHPCPYCTKLFACQLDVTTHMKNHTRKDRYKCKYCDKTFMKNVKLKRHMLVHTGEKPYECSQCDKSFTTNSYLKYHYNYNHGLDGTFVCDKCRKFFLSADLLLEHVCAARSVVVKREYKCGECGKICRYKWKLQEHLETHGGTRKVFKCELCCRQFLHKRSLVKHIEKIHPKTLTSIEK